jgi:RNA polymerase sigma-70 factor (ECF subfamily)
MPKKCQVTSAGFRAQTLQFQTFDREYLEKLCSGDFRTQNHFVSYFSELIQLKLRSRLKSRQAIEDVRQETFVRFFAALRKPEGIREPERLGAFVNSICSHVLLEYYRASTPASSLENQEIAIADDRVDTFRTVSAQQMEDKVREIIEQMPERDRRIVKEVLLEERDKDEVCRDYGVTRDYLRVMLHRAKQSFKSLYLKNLNAGIAQSASPIRNL